MVWADPPKGATRKPPSPVTATVEVNDEGYIGSIVPEMLHDGVTVAWTLNQQRVIRLEPPLIVTEGEVEIALSAFSAGVEAAATKLGRL